MRNGNYNLVVAPEDYPGKKYRNKYCSEHTLVYWQKHGVVPQAGEIIHHIDGNKLNNSSDNLQLMSVSAHVANHVRKRGMAYLRLKCPGCGKEFILAKYKSYLNKNKNGVSCCSRQCIGRYTALTETEKAARKGRMFIEEFRIYNNDFSNVTIGNSRPMSK